MLKSTKVTVDMSYEDALPLMKDLSEFKEVELEEDRKTAFDKYIKRMKVSFTHDLADGSGKGSRSCRGGS